MKPLLTLTLCVALLFSCKKPAQNPHKDSSADSIIAPADIDTIAANAVRPSDDMPKAYKPGTHPVTLQWIGWDHPGKAELKPIGDGWYLIDGSQLNADREYLNIKGKIRRISARELEFDGTVETRVRMNNGGEPCIKTGNQRFFAKGGRTYYRLQDMENCAGGNLLDYIDIYPGSSGL